MLDKIMLANLQNFNIFKQGSKTFFTASLFFPGKLRRDVFDLYAFVRTADNYVDVLPQKVKEFNNFWSLYQGAVQGKVSGEPIIDRFVLLQKKYAFEQSWVDAFFGSMNMDLHKSQYDNLDETLHYIYGSAEVIGLMMARLMNLPIEADFSAKMLGRAFQYMNMIRDFKEDYELGRVYFPKDSYQRYGFSSLTISVAKAKPKEFSQFMLEQIALYKDWRTQSEAGFSFIPKRYQLAIRAATEAFDQVISVIEADPLIVLEEKVSVSRKRIVLSAIKQLVP